MIPRLPINLNMQNDNKIWFENESINPKEIDKYIDFEGKIYLGEAFDQPINFLTSDVKWIIFTEGNNNITHCLSNLPDTVIGIVFTELTGYDSNFDNLPNSIKYISFCQDTSFNSPINNLPNSIKYLQLPDNFSQPIDCLPDSLEVLKLGSDFNHPINRLPQSLKYLKLGTGFKSKINSLPESLKVFVNESVYCDFIGDLDLDKLKCLNLEISKLNKQLDLSNTSIKILSIILNDYRQINKLVMPLGLEKIIIKKAGTKKKKTGEDININNLPEGLKIFELTSASSKKFKITLPDSILNVKLCIGKDFDLSECICSNKEYFVSGGDQDEYENEDNDEYIKNTTKTYYLNFL
jgi:hypothetical protein